MLQTGPPYTDQCMNLLGKVTREELSIKSTSVLPTALCLEKIIVPNYNI